VEFFEKRIRPVVVARCYRCHNSAEKHRGGLAVDHRDAIRKGGDSGPAVVPGDPGASLLLQAVRHETELRMPKDEPKLEPEVVADVRTWIEMGAWDPRDAPPSSKELALTTSWEAIREQRKRWWSFQPIRHSQPPEVDGRRRTNPVDGFIDARLERVGLAPVEEADRRTLIRRLTYVLTGLPPSVKEIASFVADDSSDAYERLVDRLLASHRFGERWARHWMDCLRYSEGHGGQGDPQIPYAWRYRDYLIRALNRDVPYDRLIEEHVAGDLIADPRIDRGSGVNESVLGVGQYRFVQHGYAPTDALDEQARFTENQIDVLSKAFLGLTVSCARCHDHKFDPISQRDYYALYGIMTSSRPALVTVDGPGVGEREAAELSDLKLRVREALADVWLKAVDRFAADLLAAPAPSANGGDGTRKSPEKRPSAGWKHHGEEPAPAPLPWQVAIDAAVSDARARSPLHAFASLREAGEPGFEATWGKLQNEWKQSRAALEEQRRRPYPLRWNLASNDVDSWYQHGLGLASAPAKAGAFHILPEGERVVSNIYPAGVYSHLLSSKHSAVLTSPRFEVDTDSIWVRVLGVDGARIRYSMRHYPLVIGNQNATIYKSHHMVSDEPAWMLWDKMEYWRGDQAYLEIATGGDLPTGAEGVAREENARSWFGIQEVVMPGPGQEPPKDEAAEVTSPLFEQAAGKAPTSLRELAVVYSAALRTSIQAWQEGTMTDEQANFLGFFVRRGLLLNSLGELSSAAPLVARYREVEARVPVPVRAPGVLPGDVRDQELFERGNHKRPLEAVPRRFLEVFDATPYPPQSDGRLELARDLLRPDNPLTARVAVNRIWHYVFGRGIVATPDNFGHLGEQPSHPELLDYLATRFVDRGWSIKSMIRLLVTSEAFRRSPVPSKNARELDPDNILLSHAPVRRLEAEAIRDALLEVSGQLDRQMFGPSVDEQSTRRSVYVLVRRNPTSPFLAAFDAPVPFTTEGRRAVTNVPAQSLTLMNDPFVHDRAKDWAARVCAEATTSRERFTRMFEAALGREPTPSEIEHGMAYLEKRTDRFEAARARRDQLESQRRDGRKRLAAIVEPAKAKILAARGTTKLAPIARWEFDGDLKDSVGNLHGTAYRGAKVVDGWLRLDGGGFVATAPFERDLTAKTLEIWLTLETLSQSGGGAITVQKMEGDPFDSIVFGERVPQRWMAGSEGYARYQSFDGPEETKEALGEGVVHLAIVYSDDGMIACYRNGQPYGKPYKSPGPMVTFPAGKAHVLFGMRHGTPTRPSARLRGTIERAQLHDRALTPAEVVVSAHADPNHVSRRDLIAALSPHQRVEQERLERQLAELDATIERETREYGDVTDPNRAWQDVAHAIFNFKEFIYVK
jgi:hypothetical protein